MASNVSVQVDWRNASKTDQAPAWWERNFANDRKAAQRTLGSLVTERSQEYGRSFAPIAKSLSDVATAPFDPAVPSEATARAGRLYDVSRGALEREQRAMGVAPVRGQDRRLSLRRAIAQVDGANRAIMGADDRRSLAQMFATDQYSDLMGSAGSIYGELAGMEANRRAQFSQAKAAQRGGLMSLGGTAAGLAMTAAMMM